MTRITFGLLFAGLVVWAIWWAITRTFAWGRAERTTLDQIRALSKREAA